MEFTENEIYLLKLAFKLVSEVIEAQKESPVYHDMRNDLFYLEQN